MKVATLLLEVSPCQGQPQLAKMILREEIENKMIGLCTPICGNVWHINFPIFDDSDLRRTLNKISNELKEKGCTDFKLEEDSDLFTPDICS